MDHGLSAMDSLDSPPHLLPNPHKTTMIERKLQYYMYKAQYKKPFYTDAVVVKIQRDGRGPDDAYNNIPANTHFMPADDAGFAEPV